MPKAQAQLEILTLAAGRALASGLIPPGVSLSGPLLSPLPGKRDCYPVLVFLGLQG